MIRSALERAKKKKPTPLLDEILFDTNQDRQCIEILHIGAFDDEPARKKCMIGPGSMTDPYIPLEKEIRNVGCRNT